MSRRNRDNVYDESAILNNSTYIQYRNRLKELCISMFEWQKLPDTIDPRYIELALYRDGKALFFKDKDIGELCLRCTANGQLDVYDVPIFRRAYASNGYNIERTNKDSVIIYNNYIRTNSMLDVEMFARRLYNLDRAIDVNANAQKTPVLISCDENDRLSLENLYKEYDGNAPFIAGSKKIRPDSLKVLSTGAPYVSDKLYTLKTQLWNEALTYLGISNLNIVKKERLLQDEISRNEGGVMASRYSRLNARQEACKKINDMFGLNIWCEYRDDMRVTLDEFSENINEAGGDNNE